MKPGSALCAALGLVIVLAACTGPASTVSSPSESEPSPLGDGQQRLAAGPQLLDLAARSQDDEEPSGLPRIEVTVPDGWFNFEGWSLVKGETPPFAMTVSFWDVDEVYPTPCQWAGKPMIDPGRSVDGLAQALTEQPLREATVPEDVMLAGYRGKYLTMSVPSDISFDDCDEGFFESWTARGWSTDRYQQEPGQVDRIWILDVEGFRLVVDASYLPATTAQDRAELEGVVRSLRFVD